MLVRYADGVQIDREKVFREVRRHSGPKPQIFAPVTNVNPKSSKLDLSFIPPSAVTAVIVHPRRMSEHPVLIGLPSPMHPDALYGLMIKLPVGIGMGWYFTTGLIELCDIPIRNIDEVVFLSDKSFSQSAIERFRGDVGGHGVVLRTAAPIDVDAVIDILINTLNSIEVQEYAGITLIVQRHNQYANALALINDSILMSGELNFIKQIIDASESPQRSSPLLKRLAATENRQIVLAIDLRELKATADNLTGWIPHDWREVPAKEPLPLPAVELTITFDMDAPQLLTSTFELKEPADVGELFPKLEGQLQLYTTSYTKFMARSAADPSIAPLMKSLLTFTDPLVAESRLTRAETSITFTVPRLKSVEGLSEAAHQAKSASLILDDQQRRFLQKKRQFSPITLAFHNYHDKYSTLPALNGPGIQGDPHPGLSWRVYLLPFLGEEKLYREFRLDQPWDSEHNKALIPKMPKIFGTNAEGKTSMHVFTGKEAPFSMDEGMKFSLVSDTLPNTLLMIEAGDDVAEIWTKPGGLEFDASDPLKCLGKTRTFVGALMDGAVREFRNINPEFFGKLVRHRDNQEVDPTAD